MIVFSTVRFGEWFLGCMFLFEGQLLFSAPKKPIAPKSVEACMSRSEIKVQAKLETITNPYYLRGDFDGDGREDYAVSVQGRKTQKAGVVLCHASGYITVLGADTVSRRTFSDLPGDQFLSADWCVLSKSDAAQRVSKHKSAHHPTGEAILMPWDDGEGLVFFDGTMYRWLTLRRADRF